MRSVMDGTRDGKGAAVTAPFYLPQGDEIAVFDRVVSPNELTVPRGK